ncbi:MAG: hypothetical protein IIA87_00820 [Nanoarchaeota archaeon]|nr:hypothetical protein [Nanoarchaeota archaeon]
MPDLQKLYENKEKIISTIKTAGPSFPARISRETGISPLFVSAFLSELVSERKLKLSNMKVGSSPLYFIIGQEAKLENFVDYLNSKEKEAFILLKESQILEDEKQQPAIRVALRKIKDFALPITVRVNGESRLFWRFFMLPNEQIKIKIQQIIQGKIPRLKKEIIKPLKIEQTIKKPIIAKQKKPKQIFEFPNLIKEHLSAKDIEILEEISAKKKEFVSKIRTDDKFGKQEYYLMAKEKKKINSNDLTIALQKAQTEKMPALFISTGELDKKAQEYLQQWKNLIKFEKINY